MKKIFKMFGSKLVLATLLLAVTGTVMVPMVSAAKINSGSVSFFASEMNLAVGETKTLSPIGGDGKVKFESSDDTVVTVSAKGKIKGIAKGTADITATSNDTTATIKIIVTETSVTADRYALELVVGEEDTLKASVSGKDATVAWASSDEKVVTVDGGHVKGISVGKATVTLTAGDGKYEVPVYVVEKEYSFDDNIMISIFWPPTQGYINDEQYKLMADAGITWIMGSGDNLGGEDVQKKMLDLAYKYGIHMTVGDGRLGGNLTGMSPEEIKNVVDIYRNVPGANGYYMLDEPFNPNVFIDAYKALKELDPNSYMHLNFLPYSVYGNVEEYKNQMNDWLKLCANMGYPQDYLMYDLYPFGLQSGSMNRDGFVTNLEAVRTVGLRNNVKTGTYIQSVTQSVAFRSPNKEETRYEINMALAFGVKQLSYFTWFTPFERNEPFENGIISETGVPNKKYEFISELNKYVLTIGKTLINCDAIEVYQSRSAVGGVKKVPKDFFVKFGSSSEDFTVSYLRDKTTGRNYCMVVNNNFSKTRTCNLTFIDDIKSLMLLDESTGQLVPVEMNNNKYTAEVEAGGAIILALPEDYDYSAGKDYKPAEGDNLARHAEVFCDTSVGSGSRYMDNLNDGERFDGKSGNGWSSDSKTGMATITLDFGQLVDFNRVDLYPCGTMLDYGTGMPEDFRIRYSQDGQKWKTAAAAEGFKLAGDKVPSVKFDTVNARYLKIEITKFSGNNAMLNEIEVYCDNGSVPAPESIREVTEGGVRGTATPAKYTEGENIALHKKVQASTYPGGAEYKGWGWWPDFVCDGNIETGWTSNVKIHMNAPDSTEYCIIDLTDMFDISKVNVIQLGCWPIDFQICVSVNGTDWKTVATETNSQSGPYTLELSEVTPARYVMFKGTKLRGSQADGNMLQLGEIEVYGKPYTDIEELKAFMQKFTEAGGSTDSAEYKAVAAVTDCHSMTQNSADILVKAMFDLVGLKITSGNDESTVEYKFTFGPFADDEVFEEITTEEITTITEEETTADGTVTEITTDEITTPVAVEGTTVSEQETVGETTAPEAQSGGCGSAIAASALVSSMTLAGAALIKKRKKQ